MESILKIKELFPTLKAKSIDNIQRMIKGNGKPKPCINMTTKGLLRKQVIIPMNEKNKQNLMEESSTYVTNINRALKNIKSEVMVNFVWVKTSGIIIVTNKVTLSLDLQIIENYIKNANCINTNGVKVLRLSQSKFYFKIIGISYLQKSMNNPLTLNVVEDIIKSNPSSTTSH